MTATMNATTVACDAPVRDRSQSYNAVSATFGAVSVLAVVLRLLSRYLSESKFGKDDYAIAVTLVSILFMSRNTVDKS